MSSPNPLAATTLKWWTSKLLPALVTLALIAPAHAGRKQKPSSEEPVVVDIIPEPIVPSIPPLFANWSDGVRVGEQPAGLASLSAQTCNACHVGSHDTWNKSSHGVHPPSAVFLDAIREVGQDTCQGCHLPLQVQRPNLISYDDNDVKRPILGPNPHFNATLSAEGVTCAACHVRDGAIVSASPPANPPPVHANMTWSADLTRSEVCAACHQLTWPGADLPLYDTYGEWQRSPQAAAGIQCQDCHLASGSESSLNNNHNVDIDAARALTILVELSSAPLVRGGAPLPVHIRLLNTGAGHAFPTGTPWKYVVIETFLERTTDDGTEQIAPMANVLGRTLSDAAPWTTTKDTRLPAGGVLEIDWEGALPQDAATGPWWFVVRLTEEIRGVRGEQPLIERRYLLRVE